jgi:catalase (peroxidase I)
VGRIPRHRQAGQKRSPQALLVNRAARLTLTIPEMTVLIGGMRALNANYRQSPHGVLTTRPGQLANDSFVNLLDMRTEWTASAETADLYEGRDRATGEVKWTATAVDLMFASNSELRAVAEVRRQDLGSKGCGPHLRRARALFRGPARDRRHGPGRDHPAGDRDARGCDGLARQR